MKWHVVNCVAALIVPQKWSSRWKERNFGALQSHDSVNDASKQENVLNDSHWGVFLVCSELACNFCFCFNVSTLPHAAGRKHQTHPQWNIQSFQNGTIWHNKSVIRDLSCFPHFNVWQLDVVLGCHHEPSRNVLQGHSLTCVATCEKGRKTRMNICIKNRETEKQASILLTHLGSPAHKLRSWLKLCWHWMCFLLNLFPQWRAGTIKAFVPRSYSRQWF